jgi:hypothetical protein
MPITIDSGPADPDRAWTIRQPDGRICFCHDLTVADEAAALEYIRELEQETKEAVQPELALGFH